MDSPQKNLVNATIMMIDDEEITMDIVQAYLEEDGYSNFVKEVNSSQAMLTLEKVNPDTLFLDLVMPEKSGFEILAEIRQHPKFKHLPVIILTSSTDTEDKLKALELGATDLLAKPVDQSELRLRLRNTLGSKAYVDQLVFYNSVTNLPNKHLFKEHLNWVFDKAIRHEEAIALLSIALDNLGEINAAMGQSSGDEVLREIANRIERVTRQSDFLSSSIEKEKAAHSVYHTEGNIFSLVLDRIELAQDAATVATRIMNAFKEPMTIGDLEVYITLSIGIATYPSEGNDSATLMQLADNARNFIKKRGGNAFQFSSKAINGMYERKMSMESMLRSALKNDEFVLHYQPKVNVRTGQIQGVEALLRWNNGSNGIISPVDFIPLAEETGLIVPIGEWILNEACRQLTDWRNKAALPLTMNINLSTVQFNDDNLLAILNKAIAEHKTPPKLLTLEITESLLMNDIDHKISIMRKIRDMGLKISIDDFGTGYSSLSYLTKLPVNELKIDRSFIINTPHMSDSNAIVQTVIFLAKKLGLKTIAEGVETNPQLQFLNTIECDEYQGFLFSRPLPAESFYQVFLKKYARTGKPHVLSQAPRETTVIANQTQVVGIHQEIV